jgi:hypothetical protein
MHTFVVRIHSTSQLGTEPRGIVDEVVSGARTPFHDRGELLEILLPSEPTDPEPASAER